MMTYYEITNTAHVQLTIGTYPDTFSTDTFRIEVVNNSSILRYQIRGLDHRIGKPAVYYKHINAISWFLYGIGYEMTRPYCEACGMDEETIMYWLLKYGPELPEHYTDDDEYY